MCVFEWGSNWGQRGKSSPNAAFLGKCHDNKMLKVQILLSRNLVVIAQVPIVAIDCASTIGTSCITRTFFNLGGMNFPKITPTLTLLLGV